MDVRGSRKGLRKLLNFAPRSDVTERFLIIKLWPQVRNCYRGEDDDPRPKPTLPPLAMNILQAPQLRQHVIRGVRPTGISLGSGAYGSVQEVTISGRPGVFAAKIIHNVLFQSGGVSAEKFVAECLLVSTLCHPRVVRFLGVCSLPNFNLPALVMEKLLTNLHDFLITQQEQTILFARRWSIMNDVASGLAYLHNQTPYAIIHRDLSAKNVLLDSSLRAKVADLGNARFMPVPIHDVATMTGAPGTLVYMPPEVQEYDANSKAKYNTAIDIFSFGVLSIFILTQLFPTNVLAPTYRQQSRLVARTELERRHDYMQRIYHNLCRNNPVVKMIEQCLENTMEDRPTIEQVLGFLKQELSQCLEASLVLAGVGNAVGFKNGAWESCQSGTEIHREAEMLGGIENIVVNSSEWMVSDDTLLTIATAESLVSQWNNHEDLYQTLAGKLKESIESMTPITPGQTCSNAARVLEPNRRRGYIIPFNPRGGGCGAAMRAAPIGLCYWRPEQIDSLVEVAIESGRMTHNHPTGYLGSLATALFVSYAVQKKPLREWGAGLMQTLQMAKDYITGNGRDLEENMMKWNYFEECWRNYLTRRQLLDGRSDPHFDYDCSSITARDIFYQELSFDGRGGASGHDALMIAYEALLSSWKPTNPNNQQEKRRQWIELCKRSMLHGGDCDSTGIIAGACWGAMEGYAGVPRNHYRELQHIMKLKALARGLCEKSLAH